MTVYHRVRVVQGAAEHVLNVPDGANLRRTLIAAGISPYSALTQRVNCGGRGLCATCGVWIAAGAPPPDHWHDQLAARFGYPRLSCQISVNGDMIVHILTDKRIWGGRQPRPRGNASS